MLDQAQRSDAAPRLVALAREATQAADALLAEATAVVRQRVTVQVPVGDGVVRAVAAPRVGEGSGDLPGTGVLQGGG